VVKVKLVEKNRLKAAVKELIRLKTRMFYKEILIKFKMKLTVKLGKMKKRDLMKI